jgi:hypothetical protein
MSTNTNPTKTERDKTLKLTLLTDDGDSNNFDEFEHKAKLDLRSANYWQYVEGPTSTPPIIPRFRRAVKATGLDDDGNQRTINQASNEDAVKQAIADAMPWSEGDAKALAAIVKAVPASKLHLVKKFSHAKEVWDALKAEYRSVNSMKAARLKQQIVGYRFIDGYDMTKWRGDMQRMYQDLCTIDDNIMPDNEFARHLVIMMPNTGPWRYLASQLADEMRNMPAAMNSTHVLAKLRDEDEQIRGSKNEPSVLMTAQMEFQSKKRTHNVYQSSSAQSAAGPARKRVRADEQGRSHCTNPHCPNSRSRHTIDQCWAYGGGKCGNYPEWWQGRRDLHLHPDKREKGRPAGRAALDSKQVSVHNTTHHDHTTDSRSQPLTLSTSDVDAVAKANLMSEIWTLNTSVAEGGNAYCSATALDSTVPQDFDYIFHDNGATRHVFHDRRLFIAYNPFQIPLKVNGFDSGLSAVAPAAGTIRLTSTVNGKTATFDITDVLHVPTARVNLISGSALDKKGIMAILGEGKISLARNGDVFAEGSLWKDLYRLNVTPTINPNAQNEPYSLLSRVQSRPLISRLSMSPMAAALQTMNADTDKTLFYTA